jgi:hypothetical protein
MRGTLAGSFEASAVRNRRNPGHATATDTTPRGRQLHCAGAGAVRAVNRLPGLNVASPPNCMQ